jgi:3-hexulose-6-phosphate synthase
MKLQLALDRMTIPEAIETANQAAPYVDWIEVGTSLIKQFGMRSVKALREAFPDKTIVADTKTFDNAKYEFEMSYNSGADVATVMGAAPLVSIEACVEAAAKQNKRVMIDLLHVPPSSLSNLFRFHEAIVCLHVGKDQQESPGEIKYGGLVDHLQMYLTSRGPKVAIAGGISEASIPRLVNVRPDVIIVGSAITKAADPAAAAKSIYESMKAIAGKDTER